MAVVPAGTRFAEHVGPLGVCVIGGSPPAVVVVELADDVELLVVVAGTDVVVVATVVVATVVVVDVLVDVEVVDAGVGAVDDFPHAIASADATATAMTNRHHRQRSVFIAISPPVPRVSESPVG